MEKNPATEVHRLHGGALMVRRHRFCQFKIYCGGPILRSTDGGRRDAELVDSGRYYIEKALTLKTFREVASFALVIHTAVA